MLRVFAAKDPQQVQQVRELLTKNGISVIERPNVWVAEESDARRALKLVADTNPGETCYVAWHCDTCGSLNDAGSVYCQPCSDKKFERQRAHRAAADKGGILLLLLSGAFFGTFLICNFASPYISNEVIQRGVDMFGVVSCVSTVVVLCWSFVEFSRDMKTPPGNK